MSQTRPDLPPEYLHYRDEGCHLYPSCLECPLPRCIYDEEPGLRRRYKRARDQEVLRLYRQGRPAAELARRFGVSERSIYRILRRTQ
jgi:transposase-like protein